ncbi:MAG TPA: hypothetical protein VM598_05180 [Bdellovibrionota bacterium]|nr:hypothetical protein [Bdellovibrionota bacterium]
MSSKILLALLALTVALPAFGAETKPERFRQQKIPMFPEVTVQRAPSLDPKITAEIIDRAVNRKPAEDAPPISSSTAFNTKIRDPLLKATTPDLLDAELVKWAQMAADASVEPEVRYFAAHLALIRPLRSIVYRLRPLIEKKNKSVQSMAVTFLKAVATNIRLYTPDEHWKAGFDYITMPSYNQATNKQFNNIWEFQYELQKLITPLRAAANLMQELVWHHHGAIPFVWDKQTAFGHASYMYNAKRQANPGSKYTASSRYDLDRFVGHYEAEIYAARANFLWASHAIYLFNAYYQEGMMNVIREQAKLAAVDGVPGGNWFRDDFGVSSANRRRILCGEPTDLECKGGVVPAYQTRMEDRYAGYLKDAFGDLKESMKALKHSWEALQKGQNRPHAVMNPINFAGDRREGQARIDAMMAMVEGPYTVESVPTGETVTINLPAFYSEQAPKDLKRLFAIKHEQDDKVDHPELTLYGPDRKPFKGPDGKNIVYRNYYRGRPTGWDQNYWKPYVGDKDVATALRVLNQSWGGDYVLPFIDSLAW